MEEIWLPIKGYEGEYEVSSFGRVKSTKPRLRRLPHTRNIDEIFLNPNGYVLVKLCKDGVEKRMTIHRIVANAFIHNPNSLPQINHKDGDKANNAKENLEWCTPKQNIDHYFNSGIFKPRRRGFVKGHSVRSKNSKTRKVNQLSLNDEFLGTFNSIKEAVMETGTDQAGISKACLGQRKYANGFKWQYA